MVQVFYKERAALGYVALEPQLTVLICGSGSSTFSFLTASSGPDPH